LPNEIWHFAKCRVWHPAVLSVIHKLDDARVVPVDLAEGDFAIQVERQEGFLTRTIGIFSSHDFQG
jgi:hypothetical protein